MSTRLILQQDVARWIALDQYRDDADTFNSILRVAEAQIRGDIYTRQQTFTQVLTCTSYATDMPAGMISFRQARVMDRQDDGTFEPDTLTSLRSVTLPDLVHIPTGGFGIEFAVDGDRLLLQPVPSEDTPTYIEVRYLGAFAPLVNDTDTNWVLQEAFDVYLFGCLSAAAIHQQDDELEAKYMGLYYDKVRRLKFSENRARYTTNNPFRNTGQGPDKDIV